MKIFHEILEQYMQLSLKNKLYKTNMKKLNFNSKDNIIRESMEVKEYKRDSIKNNKVPNLYYSNENNTIKEFYSRLEHDARRYNRNFESETGAVTL